MAYYQFFIYGPSKRGLDDVAQTLTGVWEFDPETVNIRRSWRPWHIKAATVLRNLIGIRLKGDWLMTITGPEIYRDRVHSAAEAVDGFCDGGGYDFMYDASLFYSDEQIRIHTEAWEKQAREAEARYMASLPTEERERVEQAINDLMAHARAHEDDEG